MQFTDFKGRCTSADILIQFYDAAVDIPAEDLYYLLQTFSSMALSRINNASDSLFVERVTLNLFEVISMLNYLLFQHVFLVLTFNSRLDLSTLLRKNCATK